MKRHSHILLFLFFLFGCISKKVPEDLIYAENLIKFNPDSAISILDVSSSKSSMDQEEYATWALLNVWARYAAYKNEISSVELDFATDFFLKSDNSLRKAQAYYLRGSVNQELKRGNSSSWFEDLRMGCMEADKCKDYRLASLLYQHYGSQLNDRKWYDDGISAMTKSYQYALLAKDTNIIVKDLINIAQCYISLDSGNSMEFARKAHNIAKESGHKDAISRTYSILSLCFSQNHEYDSALIYSRKSIELQEELLKNGERKDPVRYASIAEAWKNLGNADSCIYYSKKDYTSRSIITKLNAIQYLYDCYSTLQENKDSALKYLVEYKELSAQKERNDQNSLIIKDNSLIAKELETKRHISEILTNLVAVMIIFAVIMMIVFIYRKRMQKWQNKMEMIESELRKKFEDNSEIVNKMTEKIIGNSNIIKSLRTSPHYLLDTEWNDVEKLINDTYDNYCINLRNNGYTSNNVHVAILTRLRFSTADAATILGISPASYTKAKQRLKGKFSG